jgi:hypothetical protein
VSLYQRGKSWYYDFQYRGERYTGCIGPVSKTVAKEILAKKRAEAIAGRYELPPKKLSPRLEWRILPRSSLPITKPIGARAQSNGRRLPGARYSPS